MALTNAERQKKYRERLQVQNPEKYKELQTKNAERNKKRKKIQECSKVVIELKRKQWRASQNRHRKKINGEPNCENDIPTVCEGTNDAERLQRKRLQRRFQRRYHFKMGDARIPPEKLYLWKEKENDVFIEHNNIYDHQIDGLRFLFKQFKKKNPGVILNYPRQCGKSVTIVLFLYAIRKLLQQPVLILCKDTQDAENWHQCFQMWSGFSPDEIAFEPTKALLMKQIFIKSMSDLVSFTRRSWSKLVHKGDDFEGLPQFSSVDFYIWATSTDVMKDLPFLSSIYKWINPKEKINFDHDNGDFKKQILLDAQLENIVLRRSRISMPDQQTKNDEDYCIQPKKSKKNKDATGKKIKRSKVVPKDINVNQPGNSNQEKNYGTNEDAKMDIETFINDKNPVASKDQDEFDDKFADLQYDSNDSFIIVKETKVLTDEPKNEVKTIDIASNIEDNLPNDVNTEINVQNSIRESLSDTNDTSDYVLKYSDNTDIHDNTKSDVSLNETSENKPDSVENVLANSEMKVQEISNGDIKNNDNAQDILIKDSKKDYEDIDKKIKPNVSHKTDIDSKINEMEEKAMKKFKGSILDSIFN